MPPITFGVLKTRTVDSHREKKFIITAFLLASRRIQKLAEVPSRPRINQPRTFRHCMSRTFRLDAVSAISNADSGIAKIFVVSHVPVARNRYSDVARFEPKNIDREVLENDPA